MKTTRLIGAISLSAIGLVFVSVAEAQRGPGFRGGRGQHGDPEFEAERDTFHFLLENHDRIERRVKLLKEGVETLTTSADQQVVKKLQDHVAAMYGRVEEARPIRLRDPLFAEIFRHTEKVTMRFESVENGIRVTETSDDPYVVKLIQAHAEVVSKFVEHGFAEARKGHELPQRHSPEKERMPEFTEEQTQRLLALSARFDRVYIPALALTNQQKQQPSEAAIARLRESAPTISQDVMAVFGLDLSDSKSWPVIQEAIQEAVALVSEERLTEAHEALEPIRGLLAQERTRLGLSYPLDTLHEFHDLMEPIVKAALKAGSEELEGDELVRVKELAVRASAKWARVEQTSFSASYLQLTDQDRETLNRMIIAERESLGNLHRALREEKNADILQAASAIKLTFAKTYMLFGEFPD